MSVAVLRVCWGLGLLFVCGVAVSVPAQDAAPAENVTGSGGHLLRYSSKQVEVALTAAQQAAFQQSRDRSYAAATPDVVLDAVAATLTQQGYVSSSIDRQFHALEARHDEVLVSKGREVLRGVLKSRIGMLPGRPDHASTEALVLLVSAADGHGVSLRTRFRTTVWDSNGDSRTTVVSDPAIYRAFYAGVAAQLGHA